VKDDSPPPINLTTCPTIDLHRANFPLKNYSEINLTIKNNILTPFPPFILS
jgi:hypothetical protein